MKSVLKSEEFGGMLSGTARLEAKLLKDGRYAVVAYLPPGIDLLPMVYGRVKTEAEALSLFEASRPKVIALVGEKETYD